tara:strand:- start:571 stop:1596 length:1026 start_codon:yes stop_codon:yes gene_type:complete
MAGFLDKKKRLIDYKLTEHGRSQLSTGDIRFKYYTFTDRSIVYTEEKTELDQKVSNSEFFYLPSEVTTDPGLYYNPEFYLSNEVSFNNFENDTIFSFNRTQKTFAENFSKSSYIYNKKLSNKSLENNEIVLNNFNISEEFDFVNSITSRKYPTVKFLKENVENLPDVKKDYRFSNYLKFKRLDPVNRQGQLLGSQSNQEITVDSIPRNPLNYIFKTLDFRNEIFIGDQREEVISKVVSLLSKNKEKMFYLEYELNNEYSKENDEYIFEIHKIENSKLNKLPFINLGKIFDRFNQRYIQVYLIGKFIKKELKREFFNTENSTTVIDLANNYYFINLFTLVIE